MARAAVLPAMLSAACLAASAPTAAPSHGPDHAHPTVAPSRSPSEGPRAPPSRAPVVASHAPTTPPLSPTAAPTTAPRPPTGPPTRGPIGRPPAPPTAAPSSSPAAPTGGPSRAPSPGSPAPSSAPTPPPGTTTALPAGAGPSAAPTGSRSPSPPPSTVAPSTPGNETANLTMSPGEHRTASPAHNRTSSPTWNATQPTAGPRNATAPPTASANRTNVTSSPTGPTRSPSRAPTAAPQLPSIPPTRRSTASPTGSPTGSPGPPTAAPSLAPTAAPSAAPTEARLIDSYPSQCGGEAEVSAALRAAASFHQLPVGEVAAVGLCSPQPLGGTDVGVACEVLLAPGPVSESPWRPDAAAEGMVCTWAVCTAPKANSSDCAGGELGLGVGMRRLGPRAADVLVSARRYALEAWVRVDDAVASSLRPGAVRVAAALPRAAGSGQSPPAAGDSLPFSIALLVGAAGALACYASSATAQAAAHSRRAAPTDGRWVHAACVCDGRRCSLLEDFVETSSAGFFAAARGAGGGRLELGGGNFTGALRDVIFTAGHAPSASEIHMGARRRGWWPFDGEGPRRPVRMPVRVAVSYSPLGVLAAESAAELLRVLRAALGGGAVHAVTLTEACVVPRPPLAAACAVPAEGTAGLRDPCAASSRQCGAELAAEVDTDAGEAEVGGALRGAAGWLGSVEPLQVGATATLTTTLEASRTLPPGYFIARSAPGCDPEAGLHAITDVAACSDAAEAMGLRYTAAGVDPPAVRHLRPRGCHYRQIWPPGLWLNPQPAVNATAEPTADDFVICLLEAPASSGESFRDSLGFALMWAALAGTCSILSFCYWLAASGGDSDGPPGSSWVQRYLQRRSSAGAVEDAAPPSAPSATGAAPLEWPDWQQPLPPERQPTFPTFHEDPAAAAAPLRRATQLPSVYHPHSGLAPAPASPLVVPPTGPAGVAHAMQMYPSPGGLGGSFYWRSPPAG